MGLKSKFDVTMYLPEYKLSTFGITGFPIKSKATLEKQYLVRDI